MTNRLNDLKTFYQIIDNLKKKHSKYYKLAECSSKDKFPQRGVYFFMENNELRTDTRSGNRVVRVGTHALKTGSKATLWQRLSQHKGQIKAG